MVMASAIAMRPDAGPFNNASGVRSPMAMASPVYTSNDVVVTAQSATGTCHGPTIWSRLICPVTVRSPMLIKNVLLATAGKRNTRSAAASRFILDVSKTLADIFLCLASRNILGGLPSNTSSGMSTG